MDPFTLALLGGSALASGGLSYMGSRQAAGAQSAAAQQSGILGLIAQQQAQEQARQNTQNAVNASTDYYNKGRTDIMNQGQLGADTASQYYGQGIGFQQPYMGAGAGATNQLASLFGQGGAYTQQPTMAELQMDPGYAFRFQQGEQAMTNAARAGGLAGSGGALKAATRYGQEAGTQEYQNAYNRFMANRAQAVQGLQNLAGTGANAAQTATGLAGSVGNALSGNQFNQGSVMGNLAQNTGNAISGAYTGVTPTMATLASANPYGQAMENVGQARASGYVGGASALGNALQGPANAMMAYSMMNRFAPQGQSGSYQFGGQNVPYFG